MSTFTDPADVVARFWDAPANLYAADDFAEAQSLASKVQIVRVNVPGATLAAAWHAAKTIQAHAEAGQVQAGAR